jgi:hypothetical protein
MAELGPDDPTILDADPLWRRIPPLHLVPDQTAGGVRISSAAFIDDREDGDPMSVVLGRELLEAGREPQSALGIHTNFGIASIPARVARECNQVIFRDPTDDEPAHAKVAGDKPKSVQKKLARAASWVIAPPGQVILGMARLPAELSAGITIATAHRLLLPRIDHVEEAAG